MGAISLSPIINTIRASRIRCLFLDLLFEDNAALEGPCFFLAFPALFGSLLSCNLDYQRKKVFTILITKPFTPEARVPVDSAALRLAQLARAEKNPSSAGWIAELMEGWTVDFRLMPDCLGACAAGTWQRTSGTRSDPRGPWSHWHQ